MNSILVNNKEKAKMEDVKLENAKEEKTFRMKKAEIDKRYYDKNQEKKTEAVTRAYWKSKKLSDDQIKDKMALWRLKRLNRALTEQIIKYEYLNRNIENPEKIELKKNMIDLEKKLEETMTEMYELQQKI